MALSQIGNEAGEAAHDAGSARQREPVAVLTAALPVPSIPVATPVGTESPPDSPAVARTRAARALAARPVAPPGGPVTDALLDAVRRGLAPVDPVARLLAAWPAQPRP